MASRLVARSLLYAPALMIVALAVTALGAGFHELGHATALTYGGGRQKAWASVCTSYTQRFTPMSRTTIG